MSVSFPSHPTAPAYPLVGHFPHLMKDTLEFLLGLGLGRDVAEFRVGRSKRYFVNQPDMLRDLWQDARLERTQESRKVLASVAGAGLLSQEGPTHRKHRRLMQPAFHRERLAGYLTHMVAHAQAALERWQNQSSIEVGREMKRLALDIVTSALFSQERLEEVQPITQALEALLPKLETEILFHGMLPERAPVWYLGQDRRNLHIIRTGLARLIHQRREGQPSHPPDLLDMLLLARDEDGSSLSDTEVAAQALTLVSAGFETTANTLTWMWWLLSQHPAALDGIRVELDSVLGGQSLTPLDLPRLSYLDAVIKEVQRLYPAVWVASRIATEPVELGGQPFKKGAVLFTSAYVTHRDPRYFPDPFTFRPERFLGEPTHPKYSYLPFGAGVHQCIGNTFAQWEMKAILATLAPRVSLEPTPGFQPRMRIAITLGMEPFEARLRWL